MTTSFMGLTALHTPHTTISTSRITRHKCPVHGGKKLSVAVGYTNGRPWAKCHSQGCAQADILAALNLTPSTCPNRSDKLPPRPPRPTSSVAPLPAVSHTAALAYRSGITTPKGAVIDYQRHDGKRGRHWRNTTKRRNPNVVGDGWQVRRFNPEHPHDAPAIALAEGEKDAATLAAAGLISFCAPRGAQSLKSADFTELVALAKETHLPVLLCGDRDEVGQKAMLRVGELLKEQGVLSRNTAGLAQAKGSIADLPADDLLALVHLHIEYADSTWLPPLRSAKQYEHLRCPTPKRWQGLSGDRQTIKNMRSCGNTATCRQCDQWEAFKHIERAWRGRPGQMVVVSGFGADDSTIAETVGMAKTYREDILYRMRGFLRIRQKDHETPSRESAKYMTAIRVGDDRRAIFTLILKTPLNPMELASECELAQEADLTLTVIDHPMRKQIEAIAPRSLTESMQRPLTREERAEVMAEAEERGGVAYFAPVTVGNTKKTRTWTAGGWPDWMTLPSTYQFSDGRELDDGEDFDADAIEAKEWKKEFRQTWNTKDTLLTNVLRREDYALFNATAWVSGCVDLNLETLRAIGQATTTAEIEGLIAETDYQGPVSLLRDTSTYLTTGKGWRKAYRPVLDVAGWRG